MWCPNTVYSGATPLTQLYPGDEYVDWTCFDAYNFGTTKSWSRWKTAAELMKPTYDQIRAIAPTKQIMIGEVSSVEQGGDKAAWIRDTFLSYLPTEMPAIKSVLWFDRDVTTREGYNWSVNTSTASLQVWREVVASPLYQGALR